MIPQCQSKDSGNGPTWFPISKNLGVETKTQFSSMLRSWVIPWRTPLPAQKFDVFYGHAYVLLLLLQVFWVYFGSNYPENPDDIHQHQVSSMLRSWGTPQSAPRPPTASAACSWPSGQSEDSGNGPKWFPITQNQVSSMLRSSTTQ